MHPSSSNVKERQKLLVKRSASTFPEFHPRAFAAAFPLRRLSPPPHGWGIAPTSMTSTSYLHTIEIATWIPAGYTS